MGEIPMIDNNKQWLQRMKNEYPNTHWGCFRCGGRLVMLARYKPYSHTRCENWNCHMSTRPLDLLNLPYRECELCGVAGEAVRCNKCGEQVCSECLAVNEDH